MSGQKEAISANEGFESWWNGNCQFCIAVGNGYEKKIALRAFEEGARKEIEKCRDICREARGDLYERRKFAAAHGAKECADLIGKRQDSVNQSALFPAPSKDHHE